MMKISETWLSELISFDTTSSQSNLDLIHHIRDAFTAHQIPVRLTYNADKNKANLFASLPAHNNHLHDGLILSGHTDVVPVKGQQWDTNPFSATRIDERIYGRGTSDMKSFIAVILALLPQFLSLKLVKPLHFAFSYDEEVGCLGAPALIADLQQQGIKPTACIVGEPTEMRPIIAHKGINVFRCRIKGNAAHSSLTTQGCNAIEYASQLITLIRHLADQLREQGPRDDDYDVPHSSLSVNVILGGNAANIIPEVCEFYFDLRSLPMVNPNDIIQKIKTYSEQELLPKMKAEFPAASIEIDPIASVPGLEASNETPFIHLVRRLTNNHSIAKVAYATEAGLFHNANIETIICGPGSIEQAHKANEFVDISQLQKCETFLFQLVKEYLTA
jgi:acetylornithine deacetylase